MTIAPKFIGVDIAKNWIDVFDPETATAQRIPASRGCLRAFAKSGAGKLVVFEASGGYERPLAEALAAQNMPGIGPILRAAFNASRYDPTLKAFRNRLQDAGKPTKVALIATARKLVTILNAMMKNDVDYRKSAVS